MRIAIVDDEPLARRGIRARLARWPDVTIAGEAEDAASGAALLRVEPVDVLFLDIEMPGADGFRMVEELAADERPLVVIVTAHDDRALDAYRVEAFDYVLKPIDDAHLSRTMERLRERLSERRRHVTERVIVRDRGRIVALDPAAIDWVQSDGDYVTIYSGRAAYLHKATLTHFAELLPRDRFARVHRSAIVNVERVRELKALTNGDYSLLLTTGARLKLSRRFRAQLGARLPGAL